MYEDRKMKKTISYDETNYGKLDKIRELITELANQRGMLDIEGFLKNTKGFDLTASWDNGKHSQKWKSSLLLSHGLGAIHQTRILP